MFPSRVKKIILLNPSNSLYVLSSVRQKSHYETLGLSTKATQSEIKAAFYRLSKVFHPDTNKDPRAADRFREVVSAYEALGNSAARRVYDRGQNQHEHFKTQSHKGFRVPEADGINTAFRRSSYDINQSAFSQADRVYNFKAWTDAHYSGASREFDKLNEVKKAVEENRMQKPWIPEPYLAGKCIALLTVALALASYFN